MTLKYAFDLDNFPYFIKYNYMVKVPLNTEFSYETPYKLFKLRICKYMVYQSVTYYDSFR